MNSEEYYHMKEYDDIDDIDSLLYVRVKHLAWVLGCYRIGSIRGTSIRELIPLYSLQRLLILMEENEQYEICETILDMMIECYPTKIN